MSSSTDFTAANLAFFNDLASKYDVEPWQQKMILQITTFIQKHLSFIDIPKHPSPIALLDYACGTGLVSRAFGPSVDKIKALDLSPNMVTRYNVLAASCDILSVRQARAMVGDLLADNASSNEQLMGPEYHDFDVAAVSTALHHFSDPAKAIACLAERLKVGGVLLVVDFVEEHEVPWVATDADRTIHKHGFSEKEMKAMMEGAGMGDFGWKVIEERLEMNMHGKAVSRMGFLARATRI